MKFFFNRKRIILFNAIVCVIFIILFDCLILSLIFNLSMLNDIIAVLIYLVPVIVFSILLLVLPNE